MPLNKMVEAATVNSSPFGSICHRKEKGQDLFGLFIIVHNPTPPQPPFFFSLKKGEWEIHNIISVGNIRLLSLLYIKVNK